MSRLIAHPTVRSLLKGILVWAPLWIFTTILFTGLGVGYVLLVKEDKFLASQALLVRDEANGAVMRLGRFQSQTEMKAAQETILEMAKSQQVVRDMLIAVGQPPRFASWFSWGEYPSKELVELIAKYSISVHAPKGTEFGVTEVIYLDIHGSSAQQALAMNQALCEALEARLQQVRKVRADGVISELVHARDSTRKELQQVTERLHEIERNAGSDLTDLRGMTDTVAGAATSRAEYDQLKSEIRAAEVNRNALVADREMLMRACEDPSSFIVAPGTVLNSQPGLKRLREGLVDAQISGSQLAGKFTPDHPLVGASQNAQSAIVRRFVQELKASIASVESDISLVDKKMQELESRRSAAEDRLNRLADNRAVYANLLSEVKSRLTMVDGVEKDLAEAQAARDSSLSTSLITKLDAPIVGDRPIGPGRTTIVGLCGIAGLVFGLGIVFVVTPLDPAPAYGRRARDTTVGRRDADFEGSTNDNFYGDPRENHANTPDQHQAEPSALAEIEAIRRSVANQGSASKSIALSSISAPVQELANSIAELSSEIEREEAYQPFLANRLMKATEKKSNELPQVAKNKKEPEPHLEKDLDPSNSLGPEVDRAFQELARLKAQKPSNRSEELSIQMKIQELKIFLSSNNVPADSSSKLDGMADRVRPRPAAAK